MAADNDNRTPMVEAVEILVDCVERVVVDNLWEIFDHVLPRRVGDYDAILAVDGVDYTVAVYKSER